MKRAVFKESAIRDLNHRLGNLCGPPLLFKEKLLAY